MSAPMNGAITRWAASEYRAHASSSSGGGSAGHSAGTYSPPSTASPPSSTSAKPSSGARPRVETYRIAVAPLTADDAEQPADVPDDVELAQPVHGRLHRRLLGLVSDEHEAGVFADPLLLGGADAHPVIGEHPGDGVEHARPVDDLQPEQVLGGGLVDRADAGLGEGPEGAVGSLGQVDGGVDDVAEHRARRRQPAGAPPVEHQRPHRATLD